jgi:hypothetical protein
MTHRLLGYVAVLVTGAVFAAEEGGAAKSSTITGSTRDVCEYKSRDWSAMRETLVAVSRFRGKDDADVRKIAREALAGSQKFTIGEFELEYVRGHSGLPAPNDTMCFPKKATFSAVRNDGNDAAYKCKATMDEKGKALSISCELVAG